MFSDDSMRGPALRVMDRDPKVGLVHVARWDSSKRELVDDGTGTLLTRTRSGFSLFVESATVDECKASQKTKARYHWSTLTSRFGACGRRVPIPKR